MLTRLERDRLRSRVVALESELKEEAEEEEKVVEKPKRKSQPTPTQFKISPYK